MPIKIVKQTCMCVCVPLPQASWLWQLFEPVLQLIRQITTASESDCISSTLTNKMQFITLKIHSLIQLKVPVAKAISQKTSPWVSAVVLRVYEVHLWIPKQSKMATNYRKMMEKNVHCIIFDHLSWWLCETWFTFLSCLLFFGKTQTYRLVLLVLSVGAVPFQSYMPMKSSHSVAENESCSDILLLSMSSPLTLHVGWWCWWRKWWRQNDTRVKHNTMESGTPY